MGGVTIVNLTALYESSTSHRNATVSTAFCLELTQVLLSDTAVFCSYLFWFAVVLELSDFTGLGGGEEKDKREIMFTIVQVICLKDVYFPFALFFMIFFFCYSKYLGK